MFDQIIAAGMKDMFERKERTIVALLDRKEPGWNIVDISRRCSLIKAPHINANELFCLDGVPLIEFFPLEQTQRQDGDKWVIEVTQRYRTL